MDNRIDKNEMLVAFQEYLDTLDDAKHSDALDDPDQTMVNTKMNNEQNLQSDLYSLFVEMSALKNEIKIQARQFKSAIDDFREVFVALRETQEHLEQELQKKNKQNRTIKNSVTRSFLLELITLRDRIILSIDTIENYSPKGVEKLFRHNNSRQNSILEGQKMTLRRIDRQLKNHQVRLVKTQEKRLNPHLMKVVALGHQPEQDNGLVLEEIRAGFIWNKKLLRSAEVKVNKLEVIKQ